MRLAICNWMLIAVAVSGCAKTQAAGRADSAGGPASTSKLPTTQPILYHRTGGVARTDDRVIIWPDAFVQVHGKLMGDADVFMPKQRLAKLWQLALQHEGEVYFNYEGRIKTAESADAYTITLYVNGHIEQFKDVIDAVDRAAKSLARVLETYAEIEAIAAEAANPPTSQPTQVP